MNRDNRLTALRRPRLRLFLASLCLVLSALPAPPQSGPADGPSRVVLVIFPYGPDHPAWEEYIGGLKRGFSYERDLSIRYVYEFLDLDLAARDTGYLAGTAAYLRDKHALKKPDLVIASPLTESFASDFCETAFPGVPVILASVDPVSRDRQLSPAVHAISGPVDFLKTVELALTLRPKTGRVYFALGSSPIERAASVELRKIAPTVSDRVEFVYFEGMYHDELLRRVSVVERESAVVYCGYGADPSGRAYDTVAMAREIVQVSPVPVYAADLRYLGTGIVGGYLWSAETFGKNVAINAVSLLDGPDAYVPRFGRIDASSFSVDWNAVKRWKLDPAFIPGNASILNADHGFLEIYGVYVLLFTLLVAGIAVMGVVIAVYVYAKRRTERELDVVNLRLSLALKEGAELNRRLDSRALRDPHTGLFIRKHVDERIEDEFIRYEKTGAEFALIQVDVDSFGTVNDRFGRETGNILLSRIAGELIKLVRLYDVLARWSGEEFMILLPDTDEDTAVAFAERIRKAVSGAVYFEQEHKLVVTISCGVASSGDAATVAELIRNAGTALSSAQKNGRNRVVRYSSVSAP